MMNPSLSPLGKDRVTELSCASQSLTTTVELWLQGDFLGYSLEKFTSQVYIWPLPFATCVKTWLKLEYASRFKCCVQQFKDVLVFSLCLVNFLLFPLYKNCRHSWLPFISIISFSPSNINLLSALSSPECSPLCLCPLVFSWHLPL